MLHPTIFFFRQFYRIVFSLGILFRQLFGVVFLHFLFEAILQNCIIKIFTVRQLSGVVSPHFVLKQLYGVIFQQYFFQDNSTKLYSQNISFKAILRNCILKIFSLGQLCGVVFPHFPLWQFCRIGFLKHFIWGNSLELYSQTFFLGNSVELYSHNTSSLRQFYEIVFSKHFLWGNSTELYS